MAVKPVPDGFHTVTPYVLVEDATRFIEFLKQAFDAKEIYRSTTPDGVVNHAQMQIGDSMLMTGQGRDEWKAMPASFYLYVPDMDAVYRKAVEAGGVSIQEPMDHDYGDRSGGVKDAFGNQWWIATHIADMPH